MENVANLETTGHGGNSPSKSDFHKVSSDELGALKTSRQLRRQRIHTVHCYIAQTTVSAVAASAAILSSEEDDISSNRSMNPFVALTRLFSTLHEAFGSILGAIGRPPRLPLMEQNSSCLLVVVDLCLLSTLVALLFLLWAFLGNRTAAPQECTSKTEDESLLERILMRFRVLVVMILSVLGGGFLNVKHSIRSALFLGL
mmetsp:Transcript_2673/g.4675  ORF Transcript_2673/g.4675 Transcript_2673/m.4675 type:complete len:200 (-) Transcript_2673:86-685(-)